MHVRVGSSPAFQCNHRDVIRKCLIRQTAPETAKVQLRCWGTRARWEVRKDRNPKPRKTVCSLHPNPSAAPGQVGTKS